MISLVEEEQDVLLLILSTIYLIIGRLTSYRAIRNPYNYTYICLHLSILWTPSSHCHQSSSPLTQRLNQPQYHHYHHHTCKDLQLYWHPVKKLHPSPRRTQIHRQRNEEDEYFGHAVNSISHFLCIMFWPFLLSSPCVWYIFMFINLSKIVLFSSIRS